MILVSPDALPERCQQFSSPAGDVRLARRRNLAISPTGEAHTVGLGVGPGLVGIEWDWPLEPSELPNN